ncbi:putative sodium-dependent multivitamin transporter [Trichonephila inaurata madagascariensis]|uniref:Putative sodium-dependent multivitamin transporter n=1 Tax=Trichonephila inaurata madagascariensis TaxID=2747483 RepID=A0A8X6Y9S8_9ARAC|nr:putative sodium-dependent multivitamin transporter [Trichonephila inaurata madagascariensis]
MKDLKKWTVATLNRTRVFEVYRTENGETNIAGTIGKFLEVILTKMKIQYDIVIPKDHEFGRKLQSGNWTGLLGMIQNGEADMAANTLAICEERLEIVDFSFPYNSNEMTFATLKQTGWRTTFGFVYLFDFLTWMLLFVSILLSAAILFWILKDVESYSNLVFNFLGSLLRQPFTLHKRAQEWKFMVGAWFLLTSVITSVYAGVLLSFLTVPSHEKTVATFRELSEALAEGTHSVYTAKGTFLVPFLRSSDEEYLRLIGDKIDENDWYISGVEMSINPLKGENSATIGSENLFKLLFGVGELKSKVLISDEKIFPTYLGMALRKDFCCAAELWQVTSRLASSGIYEKFHKQESYKYWLSVMNKEATKEILNTLSFQDLSDQFLVLSYLERRFGRTLRRICSLTFSLQVILYTAVCLYAPALALSAVTSLSLWTSIITVSVVCTFYCALGGMKAVLWTDVLQALLMYVGLVAMLVKGTMDVGGLQNVWSRAEEGGRLVVPGFEMDFTSRYTFLNIFMYGFVTSLSAYGVGQMQVQRMLTVSSVKKARFALFSSIPVISLFHVVNVFVGLVVYANFFDCDPLTSGEKAITKPDQLLPYFSLTSLRNLPGMPGLCICGILSAALSTLSSLMNSLTTVTVEDFMRPILKLSDRKNAVAAKFITLFYGILSLFLTYIVSSFGNVLQASTIVYGLVAGPTLGVFLLGVLTARTNEKGAVIGLIVSLILTAWISFGSASTNIAHSKLPVSVAGCTSNNMNVTSTISPMTTTLDPEMGDHLPEHIFPLFKVSYMWFSPIGTLTTIIVGYLTSYICSKPTDLEGHLLNPIARKFLLAKDNKKCNIQLTDYCISTENHKDNQKEHTNGLLLQHEEEVKLNR